MNDSKSKYKIAQIIFWAIFFLFVLRFIKMGRETFFDAFYRTITIVFTFTFVVYANVLVFIPKLLKSKKELFYGLAVLILIIGIPYLFVEFDIVHPLYKRPNQDLIKVPNNNRPLYTALFLVTSLFIFVSTIIKLAIDSFKQEHQKNIKEKEHLQMENKYMRSQMNPHFFLNALNNLKSINKINSNQSEKYIDTLADMMRYVTYDCKNDKVELEKEINYIKNYIYFQQTKDDDINVELSFNIKNMEYPIEPMLLMPFIENAFKFGIFELEERLKISIYQEKEEFEFSCTNYFNNLKQNQNDPSYSGLGVKNVKERLKISYPNNHILEIEEKENFYKVKLKITPYNNGNRCTSFQKDKK